MTDINHNDEYTNSEFLSKVKYRLLQLKNDKKKFMLSRQKSLQLEL